MEAVGQRLFLSTLLLLAGCLSAPSSSPPSMSREPPDGPPDYIPADLAALPDPIPRSEPRSARGNPPSYTVLGKTYYVMGSAAGYYATGLASWYGRKFHGRLTSSGEPFDMFALTAAHRSLPIPTYVRVTNLDNGRASVVRVNDRVAGRYVVKSITPDGIVLAAAGPQADRWFLPLGEGNKQ